MTIQYTQLSAGSELNDRVEYNYCQYWFTEASVPGGSGHCCVASHLSVATPFNIHTSNVCVSRIGPKWTRMNIYAPTRLQSCDGTWVVPIGAAWGSGQYNAESFGCFTCGQAMNYHQGNSIIEIDQLGNITQSKFNSRYFPCKSVNDRCGCAVSHFIGTQPVSTYVLKDGSAVYDGFLGHCGCISTQPNSGSYFNCSMIGVCNEHCCECYICGIPCRYATHDSGPGATGNIIHKSFHLGNIAGQNPLGTNGLWICCPCNYHQSGTMRYGGSTHSMQYSVTYYSILACHQASVISFVFNEEAPEDFVSNTVKCAQDNGSFDGTIFSRNIHTTWSFRRCSEFDGGLNARQNGTHGLSPFVMDVGVAMDPYDCNNFYVGWVNTISRCGGAFCCGFYYQVQALCYLCCGCSGYQEYCRDYGNTGQIIKYTAPDWDTTCEPTFVKSWQFRAEDMGAALSQAMFTINDIETRNCHLYVKPRINSFTEQSMCSATTTLPNVLFCECNCAIKYVTQYAVQADNLSVPFDWVYTCRCTWITLTASNPSGWTCVVGCNASQVQLSTCMAGGWCSLYLTEWSSDLATSLGTVEIIRGSHLGQTCYYGAFTAGSIFGSCIFGCTDKTLETFRINYNPYDDSVFIQMQSKAPGARSRNPDFLKIPSDISCTCDYYKQLYTCGKVYSVRNPQTISNDPVGCAAHGFSVLCGECSTMASTIWTSAQVTTINDPHSTGWQLHTRIIPRTTHGVLTQQIICSTYCFCDKPEICYAFCGLCVNTCQQGCHAWNCYISCVRCYCLHNPCSTTCSRTLLPQGYVYCAYRPYNEATMSKETGGFQKTPLHFDYT
jgi:hypothetical protein